MNPRILRLLLALLLVGSGQATRGADPTSNTSADRDAYGIEQRVSWTTSKIQGTPDPPPPFRAERIFPHINFNEPTVITSAPGTDRLFVAEHRGKIFSIPDDQDCRHPDLMLDVAALVQRLNDQGEALTLEAVYGLTFHPRFADNRFVYVCYVVRHKEGGRGQHPDGTRVVRLRVSDTDPPVCEIDSEQLIITWLQGGHNGGCLKFGADGCLYISTGDGGFAFPPDGLNSGQDVTNLLSAILRIDVDHPTDDRAYSIPADNPFVDLADARGEIWAYGLRNPWKMSFDRKTGELWTGDVGWELWELVYRVRRGDNFGWSLVEGPQPVHAERQRGPTPIVPPTVQIPHTDGASVTGGFVYRGKKFPELDGTYIFGDWETRRIWGVNADAQDVGPRKEIVEPTVRIVGFAEDSNGELLLLDYDDGTIHQLVRTDESANREFPRRLSQTGLFNSVARQQPAPGVIPFSINAPQWSDHATAERLIAVPGRESVRIYQRPHRVAGSMFERTMDFPENSVLAKTLSLEMKHGDPDSRRAIETQILHFDGRFWRGYSYEWNDEQTDAVLVGGSGKTRTLEVVDVDAPGGKRVQQWRFPSRVECIRCHNPWAEHTLAFNVPQLNKRHDYGSTTDNQIRTLRHIGLLEDVVVDADSDNAIKPDPAPKRADELARLVDPYDDDAEVNARARSYLHVNCAHCHRNGGGGSAYVHLPYELSLADTKALDVRPTQGAFGIHDAKIIAAGDPYRSVLFLRTAKLGAGRMPHVGSEIVDQPGVQLIHDWIRQLPVRNDELVKIERLAALDEATVLAREAAARAGTVEQIARRIATGNEHERPTADDIREARQQADREALQRVEARKNERTALIAELLSSTSLAVRLAVALQEDRFSPSIAAQVVASGTEQNDVAIRDLFERYLPDDQRSKRLGDVVLAADILSLPGDAERGEQLFHHTAGVQCKNCHRIGDSGVELGPDLTQLGKKYTRAQLLDGILQPSKNIDPKFVTWLLETTDGKLHTGLLVERTDQHVVLKDAQNKLIRVAAADIEQMIPQQKSLMPDLLLRDMTAQQVADLLAYLRSLK